MAGVGMEVRIVGMQEVFVSLDNVQASSMDLTPAMKRAKVMMLSSINKNFRSSGRPIPWQRLKDSTLRRKLAAGYGPYPLIRTGHLMRSITGQESSSGVVVGTSVPYARIHQYGGNAGRGGRSRISARPYLLFQREDISNIQKLIAQQVVGKNA